MSSANSAARSAAARVLVAWFSPVIYPRIALHTGARASWKKAFS